MTHQAKSELLRIYQKRYQKARKREKSRILENIIEATGYSRKHLIWALNHPAIVKKKTTRKRSSKYAHLAPILREIWIASNFLCSKRLEPFLPHLIAALKRHGEVALTAKEEDLLLAMSAATLDRLLAPARKELTLRGRSTTKPGTLLKHQIPIRTFADWDDLALGFLEVDLVAHCGDINAGEYINTLDMTDVAVGWTVCVPFMGRSERFCVQAMEEAQSMFPFLIRGIDSDNDSIFINAHFMRHCQRKGWTFTRGRPYKKNDQCHVEQKNWNVVRKMVGYERFDTEEQLALLQRIYRLLALYQNYFQPSRKLIAKERVGSKIKKKYDQARTPCQRLLTRADISLEVKNGLRKTFRDLNPVVLLRQIHELVAQLCGL